MKVIDCFNGDADGICALTQLRLAEPRESLLITGVKRDINLLERVEANAGDQITVLDVSLDKNRAGLENILSCGADVFYCDHHFAGDIPQHPNLQTLINTSAEVCTSLLINQHLNSQFLEWAVVGTFGDNLKRSAHGIAKPLDLSADQLNQLENLGIYLNYNGYGAQLEDLYFHPADLFKHTSRHSSAFGFMRDDAETFATLESGYHQDMAKAAALQASVEVEHAAVFELPNEAWARRVSGVYGNDLANQMPARAHAVITLKEQGDYLVSVRAPLENKQGADEICRQFETGGGRAAAAGINSLAADDVDRFIKVFSEFYA
jgi:hypothetical protein